MAESKEFNFDALLDRCFEIEGLITLLQRREEEAPGEILALLREKVDTLRRDLCGDTATSVCTATEAADTVDDQAIAEATVAEEVEDAEPEDTPDQTDADEIEVVEPADADETSACTADAPANSEDATEEHEDMPSLFSEDEDLDYQDDDEEAPSAGEKSLRALFSLNDKFRFRRELFGNSDAAFTDTINLLSAMHSLDEATEYLTADLGWDPEADDVKAYLAIVSRYFNN